jgi:hypothetical protein
VSDPVAVALSVAQILEERGLRYLVGGSLARGDGLDRPYLRDRAERIGIADLLARAEAAVGRT